jgi:hypothetical protein
VKNAITIRILNVQPKALKLDQAAIFKLNLLTAQLVTLSQQKHNRNQQNPRPLYLLNYLDRGFCLPLNQYSHIAARGWDPMYGTDTNGKKSLWFYPQQSRFYEYQSTGPGAAGANASRRILSEQEALKYTIVNVLDGWDPR